MDIAVGTRELHIDPEKTGGGDFDPPFEEEGNLPVAIDIYKMKSYSIAIEVGCVLTAEALRAWQFQVHGTVMQAYRERLKEYNDKVLSQAFQSNTSVAPTGTNPDQNRQVEQVELKRQAIALVAGPTMDLLSFDGLTLEGDLLDPSKPHYPRPNLDAAETQGRVARFFEEALEWENMNYFFYPYYWGRKETWYQRVLAQDDDPLFTNFLRAGEARVAVPVRPGFEPDILYFIRSGGQIWKGAPLRDVHDTDYLSVAQEIKAAEHPELGTPGDSWEVRLPTNQVYLRPDSKLPVWQVDKQWNWTPAPAVVPD